LAKESLEKNKTYFETEHLLLVANAQTDEVVGEYMLPTIYDMMVMDDTSDFIYASHYNKLHKSKLIYHRLPTNDFRSSPNRGITKRQLKT